MLAEVHAIIASIGVWLIHDLFTSSLSGMSLLLTHSLISGMNLCINFYSIAGDGDIMHSRHSPRSTWTAGHAPGKPAGVVPSVSPWRIKRLKDA